MRLSLLSFVLLASCNGQAVPDAANNVAAQPSAAAPAAPAAPAESFVYDVENDLIEFHYGWSAETAAVPQLVARFRKEMEKGEADLIGGAKDDKESREKQGFDFHGFMSSTQYDTAGQSDRLLSLKVDVGSYEGGAHGNHGVGGLLWDRKAAREIKDTGLFTEPANRDRLLTQRWCDALNKAREEKRGEPVGGGGLFDDCPKLDEIAIIPTDKDKNGRFELLTLIASPYVAGPWAEGDYEIELAVTPDLIAGLKSDYRASFEARQPQ
ncbi:DUF4163 domain-containing protein [Sphingomonas sp. NSE70-1]|uniref:DUF4163 domain-containing protein n=1 Tax=Sphingomonas caseinilyticus TaxID=2908205 RepID=A0ABT0RSN9_9SPHN|nr:DUF4163 domain-containing protein [Sphingomonas caseinilyticus]